MPQINSFIIDTSDLSNLKTTRQFSVKADVGSEFTIIAVNNSGAYYNWKTKTFSTGHTPEKNLSKKLTSNFYNDSIVFPATTGATYNVILMTPPNGDTFVGETITTGGRNVINRSIAQQGDSQVIFRAATASGDNYGDPTDPTAAEDPPAVDVTRTGSPVNSITTKVSNNWSFHNKKSSGEGFGLRQTRDPLDTDWYFQTTNTVNGTISSAKSVVLDGVTDIVAGMVVTGVSGSDSLSGTPRISNVNTETKTVTFTSNQSFTDGATLTFRAKGWDVIKSATGLDVIGYGSSAKPIALSKTVRSGASSVDIALTDTYGISGGSHVTVTGSGINTSGTNNINTVTQDFDGGGGSGSIQMDLSSTVVTGQTLSFTGSSTQINMFWTLTIVQYPDENRIINLDLDAFITPGAAT
tara:strand:+ start:62 stop:1291 length:1230 start_codon:yes stop_codon:yes gene_type:complete